MARSLRPVQPLDVLASADRDVRINATQLVDALAFASAEEAQVYAETLAAHRRAIHDLETLALNRAERLTLKGFRDASQD